MDIQEEAKQTHGYREFIRKNLPGGSDGQRPASGFNVQDIDLIPRWYGPTYNLDGDGRFRYVEVKRWEIMPGYDKRTIQVQADAFKKGDPERFDGAHLVHARCDENYEPVEFAINRYEVTVEQFIEWLQDPYGSRRSGTWDFRRCARGEPGEWGMERQRHALAL